MEGQISVYYRDWRNYPDVLIFQRMDVRFPNANAELRERCEKRLKEKYGDSAPEQFRSRLESEFGIISKQGYSPYYLLAAKISDRCAALGCHHNVRGTGGSSFVSYLAGITDVNPLPPHKYCQRCKHVEFADDVEYVSGFDLFTESSCVKTCTCCGGKLTGDGHNLDAVFFMADDGSLKPYYEFDVPNEQLHGMLEYLTMQGEPKGTVTREEAEATAEPLFHMEILGHRLFSVLGKLEELTGVPAGSVRLEEIDVPAFAEQTPAPTYLSRETFALLRTLRPKCFSDLVRASGFAHGTGAWEENAEELIGTVCKPEKTISHRDDLLQTLLRYGVERPTAVNLTRAVRKGRVKKALTPELAELLKEKGVPEWYINSMRKIRYLFPRSHAVGFWIPILQVAWYQTHFPKTYAQAVRELYPAEAN